MTSVTHLDNVPDYQEAALTWHTDSSPSSESTLTFNLLLIRPKEFILEDKSWGRGTLGTTLLVEMAELELLQKIASGTHNITYITYHKSTIATIPVLNTSL